MNKLRSFIYIVFTGSLIYMLLQKWYIARVFHHSFDIIGLELANKQQGAKMLEEWSKACPESLIPYAQNNTYVDFLFIIGYAGMLIIISYALMQIQPQAALNNLLRFCMPLAIIAAILDYWENGILLWDLFHYKTGNAFTAALYVSYPKWIIIGSIIVFWLLSIIYNLFQKKSNA